jgi:hypothetical protein
MFALSGRPRDNFIFWVENFCGKQRPLDDIAEYLLDQWGVGIANLGDFVHATSENLRWEVERIWRAAHETRRATALLEYDGFVIDRLVKHDVECFLGVLGKRKSESATELGYAHWWLTFDKTVRDFEQKLKESLGPTAPSAPVISPDFLSNYLAVGPIRANVGKATEATIPVALFDLLTDHIPAELLDIAQTVRTECGAIDERLLRRRLRDVLDDLKTKRGELAKGGFARVREQMEVAFYTKAAQRHARQRSVR